MDSMDCMDVRTVSPSEYRWARNIRVHRSMYSPFNMHCMDCAAVQCMDSRSTGRAVHVLDTIEMTPVLK